MRGGVRIAPALAFARLRCIFLFLKLVDWALSADLRTEICCGLLFSKYYFEELDMFNTPGCNSWRCCLFAGSMFCAGIVLTLVPWAAMAQTSPVALAAQSSSERGVTVKVTPKLTEASDSRWEFAIVLDTHSADLSDDLVQSANLITNDGRTLKPVNWAGAAAGGHHREGVLTFDVPAPRPAVIELRIARPGESAPRIFRWQL